MKEKEENRDRKDRRCQANYWGWTTTLKVDHGR
jgi:hypothetical protein